MCVYIKYCAVGERGSLVQFMRFLSEIIKAVIDIERFILQYFTQSLSEQFKFSLQPFGERDTPI